MAKNSNLVPQLVLFTVVVLVTTFVYLPGKTMFMQELQNTGHSFVFAMAALISIRLLRRANNSDDYRPHRQYILVLMLCLFAGAAVEFLQTFTGSDADVMDVIRDAAGTVASLGFYSLVDKGLLSNYGNHRRRFKTIIAVLSTIVLVSALYPLARMTTVYIERDDAFPVVVDFGAGWWRQFITAKHAQMTVVPAPAEWRRLASNPVARVRLYGGAYPVIDLEEPQPDWSGYADLNFTVFSMSHDPFMLTVRVHDKKHNKMSNDRFRRVFTIRPGENTIKIPLKEIQKAPKNREMDMHEIAGVILFTGRLTKPENIYLSNIWLG